MHAEFSKINKKIVKNRLLESVRPGQIVCPMANGRAYAHKTSDPRTFCLVKKHQICDFSVKQVNSKSFHEMKYFDNVKTDLFTQGL